MKRFSLNRETLPSDLLAGFVVAVTSIPDAMASAILAGLNPIQGLYAIMVGTPVGALATGSVFMTVAVTSAMALAVGDSLAGYSGDELLTAVITLTILVGLFALLLGVLKLGTLIRFVSNAVMMGFLTGVAVLIILGQLGDFTGYGSQYSNKVAQAVDLLLHVNQVDFQTLAIGLLTIALILLFNRTRIANFSMILALVIASAAVLLLGWKSVQLIGDIADIPRSLPTPKLPDPALVPALIGPAIAIAIIGLVQGAGVGRGVPNPDGGYPDPSRDFDGQGLANIAAGFFQGMPVGGSLSTTSINVNSGAKTRWANVFSGVIVAILVLLFASLVELIPMASVAAILIVAGWGTINFEEIGDVRDSGMAPRLVMIFTFVLTLFLPMQTAVFAGVILSLLLFIYDSAINVRVVQLVPQEDGFFREQATRDELANNDVTLLHLYGTVFFAAAYTMEQILPSPLEARRAVVILRLRGYQDVGSTFIGVMERYAQKLQENGGKLMLCGVSEGVKHRLERTETTETIPEADIFMAEDRLGSSTQKALAAAERWIKEPKDLPAVTTEAEEGGEEENE
jgi:SulP family sulfate permease